MELSEWVQKQQGKQLYCVIGDPIAQSKSPLMQNRAFQELGLQATYGAFHVREEQLVSFIEDVRRYGILGLNVTIPHKLHVMDLIDELDPDAKELGAVNTIVNIEGKLIGYNTDGIGYVRSLKEEAIASLKNKRIVIIGAGGAARGIVHALLKEDPAHIVICNRSIERAEALVDSLQHSGQLMVDQMSNLQEHCALADVVVNTTSVGMYPHVNEQPAQGSWMKSGAVASDLIYNPLHTQFILDAEAHGCVKHGGLGMFIYQGAFALEYWTGLEAPVVAMRDAVLSALISK